MTPIPVYTLGKLDLTEKVNKLHLVPLARPTVPVVAGILGSICAFFIGIVTGNDLWGSVLLAMLMLLATLVFYIIASQEGFLTIDEKNVHFRTIIVPHLWTHE